MAGYTRQDTSNNISNGNVIDADDFDAEYNAVEAAFNATSGHTHDGSAGEGAPITKMGPSQDLIVSGTQVLPKVSNTLDLGSAAVQFKDAFFDGTVDTDALTVSGAATVGSTLDVTGVVTAPSGVVGDVTGDLVGDVTGTVSSIVNHNTDALTEGSTNQYFTQGRARVSISATGSIQYNNQTGVMSFTQGDTDTVNEGNTNLYYTNARAAAAISVVDTGGDGSLSYSSGVITYTGPSASEVRAHLSAGTGVTYSSGQFSIGQAVGTSSNVTFNNAVINGNLTVNGTTTTVNSNDVNIGDATLTLNSDETGTPTQSAGIIIERGTAANKSFLWDETEDEWSTFGERIKAGNFEGSLTDSHGVTGGVIPPGGIIMWSGSVASIPLGWYLCNGSNSTPDLRNRFVVGAGGSYNPGNTGGADSVTLSTSQIPAHSHSGSTGSSGSHSHSASTGSAGSHTHSASTNTVGDHTHDEYHYSTNGSGDGVGPGASCCGGTVKDGGIDTGPAGSHSHTVSVSSAGAHTHSVSVSSAGDHTHSVSIGNTGSGGSHENRPPYYALAYIMKA